jgi:hypothetical protein
VHLYAVIYEVYETVAMTKGRPQTCHTFSTSDQDRKKDENAGTLIRKCVTALIRKCRNPCGRRHLIRVRVDSCSESFIV